MLLEHRARCALSPSRRSVPGGRRLLGLRTETSKGLLSHQSNALHPDSSQPLKPHIFYSGGQHERSEYQELAVEPSPESRAHKVLSRSATIRTASGTDRLARKFRADHKIALMMAVPKGRTPRSPTPVKASI